MTENNATDTTSSSGDNRNLWFLIGGAVIVVLLVIIAILLATRGDEDSSTATPIVDPALTGRVWQWVQFTDPQGSTTVPDPSQYTVEFMPDGTVHAKADCNVGNGTFSAEAGTINIGIMAMTMAMCPPESLSDQFVNRLNSASVYSFSGNTLLLDMPMDSGTMLLEENPEPPMPQVDAVLIGKTWKWYEFNDPLAKTVVPNPDQYTVEFLEDGTLGVKADCNNASGTYTAQNGSITIEMGPMTMAMCPPESLSDDFVARLSQVVIYSLQDDILLLELPADSGTMLLSENPPEPEPIVDPALIGKTWKWFAFQNPIGNTVIPSPDQYTVDFMSDGTLAVKADCNRATGTYTAQDGSITIKMGPMTMAMCAPGSLSDQFVSRLSNAAVYFFQGDDLLIDLFADGGTMGFSENPPPPPPEPTEPPVVDSALIGKVWKWFEFQSPDGERIFVNDPDQYTVEFFGDGSVHAKADCNTANGTYTANQGSINVEMLAMTRAACAPGSYSDQFVNLLNTAAVYSFSGDTLLLDLPVDTGTMQLAENPTISQPPVDPALVGVSWKWFRFSDPLADTVVPDPDQYVVNFNSDGTINVKADCNNANGTYTASNGNISIELRAMTRAMCPPASLSDDFISRLNEAVIYSFDGDVLLLDLPMDSGTLQLAEEPPAQSPVVDAALIGRVWEWQEFSFPDGEQIIINDPQLYTVQFAGDGTLAVMADCNSGSGSYTALNGNISIDDRMAMTMAFCPPGSYGSQFVNALLAASVYRLESGDLFLDLQANAGTMRFKPR